ncbi:MAG: hypothetical protein HC874_09130 [Richelia sp. SL_2_1]|nr:hypothetical protein [Richelia sp. SL_2_1]
MPVASCDHFLAQQEEGGGQQPAQAIAYATTHNLVLRFINLTLLGLN